MEILVNASTRLLTAIGVGLTAGTGTVVEPITAATGAAIAAALAAAMGDGGITISADHSQITINPASASWTAAQTATTALVTTATSHRALLNQISTALLANATTITADLAAVQALIAALQAGTAPTAAQTLALHRFMLRCLVARA